MIFVYLPKKMKLCLYNIAILNQIHGMDVKNYYESLFRKIGVLNNFNTDMHNNNRPLTKGHCYFFHKLTTNFVYI